jgi:hypothetical protein
MSFHPQQIFAHVADPPPAAPGAPVMLAEKLRCLPGRDLDLAYAPAIRL